MAYKRIHVYYSGYVQGVGFRYTARSIAAELGIVGWARNLRDGRVEVVCEGEAKLLDKFLDAMNREFSGRYLKDAQVEWEEPTKEFSGFNIMI